MELKEAKELIEKDKEERQQRAFDKITKFIQQIELLMLKVGYKQKNIGYTVKMLYVHHYNLKKMFLIKYQIFILKIKELLLYQLELVIILIMRIMNGYLLSTFI
mgnify:CR=1 FL=1